MQEKLTTFGLTRQEAVFYLTLYQYGALSGYEVAKLTGISRSNVYNGLANLVEHGAAYTIDEGTVTKFTAIKFEEFSENRLRSLLTEKDYIMNNLPERRNEDTRYITVEGYKHIMNKINNMLNEAEYRIYLYVTKDILQRLDRQVRQCIEKNLKVMLITDKTIELPGATIYVHNIVKGHVQLIVDSNTVLVGELEESCLYSRQKNFVNVFKQSFANTIKLVELESDMLESKSKFTS